MSLPNNITEEDRSRLQGILSTCTTFFVTDLKDQETLRNQWTSRILSDYNELPIDSKKHLLRALCNKGMIETAHFTIEPSLKEKDDHLGIALEDIPWGKSNFPQVLLEMVITSRLICDNGLFFPHWPNGQAAVVGAKGELLPNTSLFVEHENTNPYEQHVRGDFASLQILAPKDTVLQIVYQNMEEADKCRATSMVKITHNHFVCRTLAMVFLDTRFDPRESKVALLSPAFVSYLVGYSFRAKQRWDKIAHCELKTRIKWGTFLKHLQKPLHFAIPSIHEIVERLAVAEVQGRRIRVACNGGAGSQSFILGDAALWIAKNILKTQDVSSLLIVLVDEKKSPKKRVTRPRRALKKRKELSSSSEIDSSSSEDGNESSTTSAGSEDKSLVNNYCLVGDVQTVLADRLASVHIRPEELGLKSSLHLPLTQNLRKREMLHPLYAVKDTLESEYLTAGHFLPDDVYATKEVADGFLTYVETKVKSALLGNGSGFMSVPDEMINAHAKVYDIRYQPFPHIDLVCQVLVIKSLFTEAAKTIFLENLNDLSFIDPNTTGGIGASPTSKARVHRASSTYPQGSISIINDDVFAVTAIESRYEEMLRDFVAEVYQEHDRIIAGQKSLVDKLKAIPINKEDKFSFFLPGQPGLIKKLYMASWIRESAVIQSTVGSTSGSPYNWHNDKEVTHNVAASNMNAINQNRKVRNNLLSRPLGSLMRVGTMVLSTGTTGSVNASVKFKLGTNHKDDKGITPVNESMSYTTDDSTVSFQMCQVQNFLQHKVVEIKTQTQGNKFIARCVNSVRYSIDGRTPGLIQDILSGMPKVKNKKDLDIIHGDYSITNVVDGTTEGALIHSKVNQASKTHSCTSQRIDMSTFNPSEFGTMLSELGKSLSGLSGTSKVTKMKEFLDEKMSCLSIIYPCSALQSLFNMVANIGPLPILQQRDRKGSPPSFRDENSVSIMKRNEMNFMEDGVPLWERLTSHKVVPLLFQNKVELSLVIHHFEENPANGSSKGWKVHAPHPKFGKPPSLMVITNWQLLNTVDNKEHPVEHNKMLREGDVLNENAVRSYFGITSNSMVSNTMRSSHPACIDAFIIARWYKNDVGKIKKLQEQLDAGIGDPGEASYDFWIGFMGGSGTAIGQTCSSIASQQMDNLPTIRKMPKPQDSQSKENIVLQKLVARQGVFALFAPPITIPHTRKRFCNDRFLQFLGFMYPYKAVQEEASQEDVVKFIDDMTQSGEKVDVDYASFMLEPHTKCHLRRSFRTQDQDIGGVETGASEWKSVMVHLLDSKHTLLNLKKTRRLPENLDEERMYGPITIPFSSSHMANDKKQGMLQLMIEIKSKMVRDFKYNIIPQLLVREGYSDTGGYSQGGKITGGGGKGLKVTAYSLFPTLIRASAAGAKRFLGQSFVNSNNKQLGQKSGYLTNEKAFHHRLGFVAQTSPLPLPVRIYDKTTAYIFQQTCETFPNIWKQQDCGNVDQTTIRRVPIGSVDNATFVRILVSIVMVRSSGNIEAIRDYLQMNHGKEDDQERSNRCRHFQVEDTVLFPLYMVSKRDINKNSSAQTPTSAMTDRCSVAPFIKSFFFESVPEYIRQGPYFFMTFLVNFLNQLQEDVMVNDSLGIRGEGHLLSRKTFLSVLGKAISNSIQSTRDIGRESIIFFTNQIVLDLDEIFCSGEENYWESCFADNMDSTVVGYGGREGLKVYNVVTEQTRKKVAPALSNRKSHLIEIVYHRLVHSLTNSISVEICSISSICQRNENEKALFDRFQSLLGNKNRNDIMLMKVGLVLSISDDNNTTLVRNAGLQVGDLLIDAKNITHSQFESKGWTLFEEDRYLHCRIHTLSTRFAEPCFREADEWRHFVDLGDGVPPTFLQEQDQEWYQHLVFLRLSDPGSHSHETKKRKWEVSQPSPATTAETGKIVERQLQDTISFTPIKNWISADTVIKRMLSVGLKCNKEDTTWEKKMKQVASEVLWCLNNVCSKEVLDCLGLRKIQVSKTGGSNSWVVVTKLNSRVVDIHTVEHMMCKLYKWCQSSRGNMSLSISTPTNAAAYPMERDDTIYLGILHDIMKEMSTVFDANADLGCFGYLESPFTFLG